MKPRDVDATPIAWRECGAGPVVVFLHGLGGSRTSWDPQLAGLADRFRCVAWDMPGYGMSAPVAPLGFGAIADRLVGLLDALGADRADLVGESFGGMHALHTAIARPDRVGRLVITNSSAVFGGDGTDPEAWKRSRLHRIDAGASPADIAKDIYRGIAGPLLVGRALDERAASFARVSASGFRAAVECLPDHDVRGRLSSIHAPTLVIAGDLDDETPLGYSEELVDGMPNAKLHVMGGVGHIAASESPDEFNGLIGDFLTAEEGP